MMSYYLLHEGVVMAEVAFNERKGAEGCDDTGCKKYMWPGCGSQPKLKKE